MARGVVGKDCDRNRVHGRGTPSRTSAEEMRNNRKQSHGQGKSGPLARLSGAPVNETFAGTSREGRQAFDRDQPDGADLGGSVSEGIDWEGIDDERSRIEAFEYGLFQNLGLSDAILDYACHLAHKWRSEPHDVLISLGWLDEAIYCRALAGLLGVGFEDQTTMTGAILAKHKGPNSAMPDPALAVLMRNGQRTIVLNGRAVGPGRISEIIAASGHPAGGIAIATQGAMREAHRRQHGAQVLARAVNNLADTAPALSSSTGLWPSQALVLAMLMGALAGAFAIAPRPTLIFIAALLSLPFLSIVLLRLTSMIVVLVKNCRRWRRPTCPSTRSLYRFTGNGKFFPPSSMPLKC